MRKVRVFLFNNSLSILFGGLFLTALAGQALTGYLYHNQTLAAYGRPQHTLGQWLGSGSFLDAIFVNWQAAVLQLGSLVLGGAFLYQQGASHSRRPAKRAHARSDRQAEKDKHRTSWIYRNSLFLGFLILFLASFAMHIFMGHAAYNEDLALAHQPPLSLLRYLYSGEFWFTAFQTWQAEFVAIFLFLIMSIFLRQEKSAESKPTGSRARDTGDTNE